MAGDWIKWCVGLTSKPEIIRAASEAGLTRHEVASRFMVFCEWADANVPEKDISKSGSTYVSLSPSDDDNRAFVSALLGSEKLADSFAANWIKYRNGRVELPNFSRHNGKTSKTRARNSKNQNEKRQRSGETRPKKHVTEMSPSGGDKIVTREEKRREEIQDTIPTHTSSILEKLGPPWNTPECARVLDTWFSYLSKNNRPPLDRDLATVSLSQMFSTPDDLREAVLAATAAGWLSVNPSMTHTRPRRSRPAGSDTITDADLESMQ